MTVDPLSLLQKMQQDSLATAPGLPEEVQAVELWTGVGFRVDNIRLVTALDHISEVLQYPEMTPVPRTKPWVRGVTNMRGGVVPVIDTAHYFGKEPIFINDQVRILVVNSEEITVGLLVSEVFGLRHFDEELERQNLTGVDDPVMAHAHSAFLRDNVLWGVFDMFTLIQSESFQRIAA